MSEDADVTMDAPIVEAGPSTPAVQENAEMDTTVDNLDDQDMVEQPDAPSYPEPPLPDNLADDDDDIAYTLPIYISHALDPSVYLFQYPLHHRPIAVSRYAQERGEIITARMKEQVGRFEIEMPVDQRAEVWNEEQAEALGFIEQDEQTSKKGKGKAKEQEPTVWGTKMRLKGEEVPGVTGYWSGIVHDEALYLHPVSHLMQFRPDLGYLDAVDAANSRERDRARRAAEGDESEDDEDVGGGGGAGGAGGAGGGTANGTAAGSSKTKKSADLKTVQVSLAATPEDVGVVRPASKMGTGGTVGSTQQIRQRLVQKIQKEAEDVWKPWKWDDVASPEVVDTLAQFLVPPDRRAMLECKTAPLDIISKKNIGEGARL